MTSRKPLLLALLPALSACLLDTGKLRRAYEADADCPGGKVCRERERR